MTKEQLIELVKLLSALESWSFSSQSVMPEYLYEKLDKQVKAITQEILK